MARFLPLEVTRIDRDTRDSVAVTLRPRDEDRAAFAFVQGQYLTLRRAFDGEELRRCYSISSAVDEGRLTIGVKRVDGGAFSSFINQELKVGDRLDAMAPMGVFHVALDPGSARHYLLIAGGSGVTPILSILKTTLKREPNAQFTLIYANKQISSIMFREELEDLKNQHLGRLSILHVLETDAQEIDLFTGRLSAEKWAELFAHWIDARALHAAFICGPEPMMLTAAAALRERGLTDAQIKFELFASGQPGRAARRAGPAVAASSGETCEVAMTLDGATRSFVMPREGQSVLDAALQHHLDAPYACKAGVCSTCRAKVLEGEAEMATNHALEDYEVRLGYVLTCQARPLSAKLVVSYDQ
ncbi:MAG: 2Fe-2S iron-sulfur cluster binding domain-containing protein [Pseudomonadota bacterium]|nr:2Fe-2S iron-sulfur cluster binding domain-containing protein [Pseudomonadota bacterium]